MPSLQTQAQNLVATGTLERVLFDRDFCVNAVLPSFFTAVLEGFLL